MTMVEIAMVMASALFLGMLGLMEAGRRLGKRRAARDAEGGRAGLGAIEGAIFALLGLLLAFTFSGAASRFDHRRAMIIDEANAIGTAYLRIDFLAPHARPAVRDLFRRYTDLRLETYRALPDVAAAWATHWRAAAMQQDIWSAATSGMGEGAAPAAPMLVVPALNEMFDIASTRVFMTRAHPPWIIFAMLGGLTLAGAFFAGYGLAGGRSRPWAHMIGFALIMSLTVYVIADIEFPRIGMFRVSDFDQAIQKVRDSMR
jgi:hypothetical protein